jgi:mRNA interferase MazF
MVRIRRGDIWYADLGEPKGSESGFIRPVLVVQDNHFNDSSIATAIVISLTSHMGYARYPGNVALSSTDSGLAKDSVINVNQLTTINKSELIKMIGSVSELVMDQIEYGLSVVLGMR